MSSSGIRPHSSGAVVMGEPLSGEIGDDGAAQVLAGLELSEDRAQFRERPRARDVAADLAARHQLDELAHVLHGADRRVDQSRILEEELEGIELQVALARRWQSHCDEEAAAAQHLEAELEARNPGRE